MLADKLLAPINQGAEAYARQPLLFVAARAPD